MRVLSLFDGMSCGRIALERAGVNVTQYFSSEIEPKAIKVSNKNWPQDKVYRLGDVETLVSIDDDFNVTIHDKLKSLPKIDILIGGSPCQGLSAAKTDRENLKDPRSRLFYNFVEILKWIKSNNNPNVLFLLENVKPTKETIEVMNSCIGVQPIEINSNLVSAQNRVRLYWTNIKGVEQPRDKMILLYEILDKEPLELFSDERIEKTKIKTKNYYKWDVSGKGYYSQQDRAYFKSGKMCCVPKSQVKSKVNVVESDGVYRRLSPVEVERLQTVPDNYTLCEGVSNTKRYEMLGNGWTVDVIAHIFSFINKEVSYESAPKHAVPTSIIEKVKHVPCV